MHKITRFDRFSDEPKLSVFLHFGCSNEFLQKNSIFMKKVHVHTFNKKHRYYSVKLAPPKMHTSDTHGAPALFQKNARRSHVSKMVHVHTFYKKHRYYSVKLEPPKMHTSDTHGAPAPKNNIYILFTCVTGLS